jgi:alkylated DNA repair dioxygenase AlkB
MATSVCQSPVVHAGWGRVGLLEAVHTLVVYAPGDDRASRYVYENDVWVPPLDVLGPQLIDDLEGAFGVRFTTALMQAYRKGSGTDWHWDGADVQAILSLGVTRTFGLRRRDDHQNEMTFPFAHGDLLFMPSGAQDEWEHCVPIERELGERCSLVFRSWR